MFGTWVKWAIHNGKAWATPGIEAVAVLREPGRYHMSTWSMIRAGMFPTSRKLGKAAFKRLELFAAVAEERHDAMMGKTPHWYLQNIAVTPARRGTGLGKVLMNYSLALADAAGLPCYLETETEKSMGLHQHHGYQVREAVDLPDGGLRFYVMVRPPRAGQGAQPE